MRCVYLIRSLTDPSKHYVGLTDDLDQRLAEHSARRSPHTAKHVPWKVVVASYFADEKRAEAFERYLKNGAGHAFARRHFW